MLYFKLPFADDIYTTTEGSGGDSVAFVSFDQSEMISFSGEIAKVSLNDFLRSDLSTQHLTQFPTDFTGESQPVYLAVLQEVIGFVRENNLPKLVLSRRKVYDYNGSAVNLGRTFLNLAKNYPNAFVYLFIRDGQCWMGAFSELLGKFHKNSGQFETMALAGTLPINEAWTTKEIEEQKPVSDFIFNVLKKYSAKVEVSETADHISGNIKHLRTDFRAEISSESLDKIIAELHPTPAVCGIPKDICAEAILDFEEHPRKLYAGYIKVDTAEAVQYFVNLRCAEFFRDNAVAYVGGGITADSNPEKEWRETELKSEAIIKNLSFI